MAYPSAPIEEHPPSYAEASYNPDQLPPSYESIYGELRECDSPSQLVDVTKKAIALICGTLGAAIVLGILNIVPIGMIVIGWINRENCAANPKIPTWMIVIGIVMLSTRSIGYFKKYLEKNGRIDEMPASVGYVNTFFNIFLVIWFSLGAIWVLGAYSERDKCESYTYSASFAFVVVTIALCALTCLCACCCCCCVCFRGKNQTVDVNIHHNI